MKNFLRKFNSKATKTVLSICGTTVICNEKNPQIFRLY